MILDSKLNREIEREIRKAGSSSSKPNKKLNKIMLFIGIILLLILLVQLLMPQLTGFVTVTKQLNYDDAINITFKENAEYVWEPKNIGPLSSLKVAGSYNAQVTVKIYLEDEGKKYLLFDSGRLESKDIVSITGLVVSDEKDKEKEDNRGKDNGEKEGDKEKDGSKGKDKNGEGSKDEGSESSKLGNETISLPEQNAAINETTGIIANETATNEIISEPENAAISENNGTDNNKNNDSVINKSISISLEYKSNTPYDADDNGIEDIYSVIDFTAENTKFSWDANESKLCTRYEIESLENKKATALCHGSESCCSFINLAPTQKSWNGWNDTLYLTYGLYDSSFSNNVRAQVVYVD